MGVRFGMTVDKEEFEAILKQVDIDYDGKMQFSEFLIAGCNKKSLFTNYNLEKCFKHLDSNADGYLDIDDLGIFLGDDVGEKYLRDTLAEADMDKDGYLSMYEFF